eukprot:13731863-Ditylum_brightwellii.AAC.1
MGCHWQPNFQPFKANAMASNGTNLPLYTKEGRLLGTYLGGGGWGNKQDIFLVAAATVVFVVFAYKNYVAQ